MNQTILMCFVCQYDSYLLGDGDLRLGDLRLGDGLRRPRPRGDGLLRPPLPRGDGDRLKIESISLYLMQVTF